MKVIGMRVHCVDCCSAVDSARQPLLPFRVLQISSGLRFFAVRTDSGLVLVCGEGSMGELGLGSSRRNASKPTPLLSLMNHGVKVSDVCWCVRGTVAGPFRAHFSERVCRSDSAQLRVYTDEWCLGVLAAASTA